MRASFEELLQAHRDNQIAPAEHLDAANLIAYAQQQLDDQQRAQVQQHLSTCRDCSDLTLALIEETDQTQAATTEIALQKLHQRLAEDSVETTPSSPEPQPVAASKRKRPAIGPLIAFAAVVFASASLWWLASDGKTQRTVGEISAQVQLAVLTPQDSAATRAPASITEKPSRNLALVLQLLSTSMTPDTQLHAVIFNQAGEALHKVEQITQMANGTYAILLQAGALPAGSYSLRLQNEAAQTIATYNFTLTE